MFNTQLSQQDPSGPQSGGPNGKKSNIGLIVTVVVAIIIIFIIVDPFGTLGGGSRSNINPAAKFVPENTDIFMTLDILQLDSEKTENLLKAFQDVSGGGYYGYDFSFDGLTEMLDESLGDIGLSYSNDIEPWLEGNIAVSLMDFDLYSYNPEFLVLIETKPSTEEEVDAFIQKFVASASEYMEVDESEYAGATLYETHSGYGDDFAIARYERFIFVSNDSRQIKSAIDQESSGSLAQNGEYKDLMKKISGDQIFTLFISEDMLSEYMNEMSDYSYFGDLSDLGLPSPKSMVMSLSVEDYGFEFTVATSLDQTGLSSAYKEMLSSMENFQSKTDGMFPEDTIMWVAANRLDLAFDLAFEMLLDMPYGYEDMDEVVEMMEENYGFDVLGLFDSFDGEFAIGLAPSFDGVLNLYEDIGLGIELIVETSKPNVVLDAYDSLMNSYYSSDMNVEEETVGKMKFFDLSPDYGLGDSFMTFGVGGGYAVLSTSPNLARDSFDGGSSLEDNPLYKEAVRNLPKGSNLTVFIDIGALLDVYENVYGYGGYSYFGEIGEIFKGIALGSGVSGNVSSGTIMIFIETP
jgi:hypothetical protein